MEKAETGMWLKSLFPIHKVGETTLHVLPPDELQWRRIIVHVEDEEFSSREAIELLRRQNEGIQSKDCTDVRYSESKGATST